MTYGLFWLVMGILAATDITITVVKWRRRKVDAARPAVAEPRHRSWRVVGSHSETPSHPRR